MRVDVQVGSFSCSATSRTAATTTARHPPRGLPSGVSRICGSVRAWLVHGSDRRACRSSGRTPARHGRCGSGGQPAGSHTGRPGRAASTRSSGLWTACRSPPSTAESALPIPYRFAIDLVDQHAEPSLGTVCNVSCTIAPQHRRRAQQAGHAPPGCAPPQRFPPRRTGYATDGQTSARTRTDKRSRRSKHRPWPTTTPWPDAPPEPARCANEQAAPAQPAVHPSSPKPQPQPPSHPHYDRSPFKRHTTSLKQTSASGRGGRICHASPSESIPDGARLRA